MSGIIRNNKNDNKAIAMQRRQYPRVLVDDKCSARFETSDPENPKLTIVNISVAGAAVVSQEPLGGVDDSVPIAFSLSPDDLTFRARCVIRCVIGRGPQFVSTLNQWLNGVYFEDLCAQSRAELNRFVQSQLGKPRSANA